MDLIGPVFNSPVQHGNNLLRIADKGSCGPGVTAPNPHVFFMPFATREDKAA